MSNSMIMQYDSVFNVCRAFYNLSTTEVLIIEHLYKHGTYVGDAQSLSRSLKIAYPQITKALTSLDEAGIIARNTTGNKRVRMRALALCPHWEYNLIKYDNRVNSDNVIKHKRQVPSICA